MSRPNVLKGPTYKVKTGCGTIFITINEYENKPYEIFVTKGRSGGCKSSQTEAIGRLASLALKTGASIESVRDQLKDIKCNNGLWNGNIYVNSCADAVAYSIDKYLQMKSINK